MGLWSRLFTKRLVVDDDITLTFDQIRGYSRVVATVDSKTITFPSPKRTMGKYGIMIENHSSGNVGVAGDFAASVSSITIPTGGGIQVYLTETSTNGTYCWSAIGTGDAAGLSVPVKCTGAEINSGTNDAKFLTPKAIADSDYTTATAAAAAAAALVPADDDIKDLAVAAVTGGTHSGLTATANGHAVNLVVNTAGNVYADLTAAEAAACQNAKLIYVVSLDTLYEGVSSGAAYTRDGTFVLNTADGGNTRWLGVAGRYVYNTIGASDGTNKAAVTPAMLKAIENANPTPTDYLVKLSDTGRIRRYADLTAAELATSVDGLIGYVLSLGTYYIGLAAGGAYTRDGTYVLNTADAGNTRWVGIAGTYVYHTLNVSDGTNKAAVTAAMLKAVETTNPSPSDLLVKASNTGLFRRYADLTAIEGATSVDGLFGYALTLETWYVGLAAGGAYVRDGTFVLNTGDAGNTRWIGIAGKYVYNSLSLSDGTNKPVITPAMLKALETTNPGASDTLVKGGDTGLIRIYADIAAAKAATSVDGLVGFVIANSTVYQGLAAGSAYTANDKDVLITGDGGDTRWIALGGAYNAVDAAWETFDPTSLLTWDTATPGGMTITGKVRKRGGTAEFKVDIVSADPGAAGGSLTSMTFPVGWQPADTDMWYAVSAGHLKDVSGAATPTALVGFIDATQAVAANRILTFYNPVVWADNEVTHLSFGGSFPIA